VPGFFKYDLFGLDVNDGGASIEFIANSGGVCFACSGASHDRLGFVFSSVKLWRR